MQPKCTQVPVLTLNYHQLQLAGCATYTMPRSLLSIRRTTTIILVNSNLNIIQGGLRHTDQSTTLTNRDVFNIESTVTEQYLPPTTSDGKSVIGSRSIYSTDL